MPERGAGLDNIPVTFNLFIRRGSIQPEDFLHAPPRGANLSGITIAPT